MTYDLKCNTRCEDKEVYNFSARVFFLCDFLVVLVISSLLHFIALFYRLNRQSTLFDPTLDGMVLDTEK